MLTEKTLNNETENKAIIEETKQEVINHFLMPDIISKQKDLITFYDKINPQRDVITKKYIEKICLLHLRTDKEFTTEIRKSIIEQIKPERIKERSFQKWMEDIAKQKAQEEAEEKKKQKVKHNKKDIHSKDLKISMKEEGEECQSTDQTKCRA